MVPASALWGRDSNPSPPAARAWGLTSTVPGTGRWAAEQRPDGITGALGAPWWHRTHGGHRGSLPPQI